MNICKKNGFMILTIAILFLFTSVTAGAVNYEKESTGYKQSTQQIMNSSEEKKAQDFSFEKIDIDTFKVTFACNKIVNVFEMEKGYFLTVIDVSNPVRVMQFYPEIGKALPFNIGVKVKAYSNMPLEIKADKGEYIIFKYEKP